MSTQTLGPRWRRPALAFGAALLALVLTVAAIPPARAWATTVLRQVGVISLVEEASPRAAVPEAAQPLPTATPIPADRPARLTTTEQVAAEAGFWPLLPAALPQGYVLADMGAMEYLNDAMRSDGLGTFFRYTQSGGTGFLEVQQSRFNGDFPREFPVGDVPVVDVTVRGAAGVWLAGLPGVNDGETISMLLWSEDGFIFGLQTNTLALEELLSVAEALAP